MVSRLTALKSVLTSVRAGDIDSEQMISVVQSKGRKDRHVMLPAEVLDLLRQWWKARPTEHDAGVAPEQRWLFPDRSDPRHAVLPTADVPARAESPKRKAGT